MVKNKKPDLKKATHECTCTTGKITKLLRFDAFSKLEETETLVKCTYKCKNCGAVWEARSPVRDNRWNAIRWQMLKKGTRA